MAVLPHLFLVAFYNCSKAQNGYFAPPTGVLGQGHQLPYSQHVASTFVNHRGRLRALIVALVSA
jgi:hypothetical protein